MENETAPVNLNCGPPLSAMNSWPSILKLTIITAPGLPDAASGDVGDYSNP
jgi:hypothetical protein